MFFCFVFLIFWNIQVFEEFGIFTHLHVNFVLSFCKPLNNKAMVWCTRRLSPIDCVLLELEVIFWFIALPDLNLYSGTSIIFFKFKYVEFKALNTFTININTNICLCALNSNWCLIINKLTYLILIFLH